VPAEHFDVLIVGAGLSGIGAGYHLQQKCPGKSYVILEGRDCIGGTWDLFRYPGIRSDSDMYTLGYSFRPWTEPKAIADGPRILNYVRETAADNGIDKKIRFHHRVKRASWSSQQACWTVEAERTPSGEGGTEIVRFTCNFLFMCSGYYKYEEGYTPEFSGTADFAGRIVHPQKWTDDIDYAGKRVVVIGSGATAVTLVPEMARTADHVTMLQRSPTYVVARPAEDVLANKLRRNLSAKLAYHLIRWRNVLFGMYFFQLCRRKPARAKQLILGGVRMALGPDYDIGKHFTPRYNPWEQRLCLVPDGDLFAAMRDGKVRIATGAVERFTPDGLKLATGEEVAADIIVTATGLNLKLAGGIALTIDGEPANLAERYIYKGMMLSGVPNLFVAFGYANASWTLRSDLTARSACRLLNHMDRNGYRIATPRAEGEMPRRPVIDFSSGYVRRAAESLPSQSDRAPWLVPQNYVRDALGMTFGRIGKAIDFT
jgi:cation diffusion facilitator CzcD-associated flavoprotein CzcO